LIFSSLHSNENHNATQLDTVIEIGPPNPINLNPEWLSYFQIENATLNQRNQEIKTLINSLYSQLEIAEEKLVAIKRIK